VRRTVLEAGVAQVLSDLGHPSAGERVVVALSGGADSVALLDAMASRGRGEGFEVVAAHLDHGLRAASSEDAAFCAELCERLGIRLRTARADVERTRQTARVGLEEAARIERHGFLRRAAAEEGARWIALAHTRDDQAETVLLRLLRGAGGLGLSAMRVRAGDLLRPMLGVSRRDVLDYLSARGLSWREDPTNSDLTIPRNRVRHELIPYLERHFNPAVREALARSAAVLAEEADVLAAVAGDARRAQGHPDGADYVVPLEGLRSAPRAVARLTVRRAVEAAGGLRGVGLRHVDAIVDLAASEAPSGRRVALPGGREAVFHFDEVRVGPGRATAAGGFTMPLTVPGAVALPDGRSLVARSARGPAAFHATTAVVAVPDAPLVVRTRRPGDRVRASGRDMSLKRFLMDARVPARDRGSLPLLAAGDRVLWVPGQQVEACTSAHGRFVRVAIQPAPGRAR